MTDPNKEYISYLPKIQTLDVSYGETVTDNGVQVVYSAEYGPRGRRPVVWLHVEDLDRLGAWARLTPENLDDLITELMYAKQQIGGDT